ncbi:hypothetical protein ACMC9I_07080 [Deinococcota bacterium DY0809b]
MWRGVAHAPDLLEAMQKKRAHEPFLAWLEEQLAGWDAPGADAARSAARRTLAELAAADPEAAVWTAKAAVAALYALADGAGGRYRELTELYAGRFLRGEPFPAASARASGFRIARACIPLVRNDGVSYAASPPSSPRTSEAKSGVSRVGRNPHHPGQAPTVRATRRLPWT